MNRINPVVQHSFQSSLMGRLKLALFKEILGKENMVPSKKEVQRYIGQFSKSQISIVEIAVYILNDARFAQVKYQDLEEDIDLATLFAYLDKYPLSKPMFYEVSGYYPDKPVGVLVHCHELKGNIGFFYAITLLDEHYPSQVAYFEIRVSQVEPEPAFCFYTQEGSWTSSVKDYPDIIRDGPVWFCVQVLKHLTDHYTESFLTLQHSFEKATKAKFKKRDFATDDPLYTSLVQKVFLGQSLCHVAKVDVAMIRPLSYDDCLMIPYLEIQEGKRALDDHLREGLAVYWKDGFFVTSDDYLTYMVCRVVGIQNVKVVILGDEGKSQANVLISGGPNLLPGVHLFRKPGIDQLEESARTLYLDEYIAKLSAVMNLKDILKSKCIIFSEDQNNQALETLLEANGFISDEITIMSYDNCTKIDLLPLTLETLRKINKDLLFVVHRDRDYLSEQKLEEISSKISSLGAIPFITKGTDIESHFLHPEHIRAIYPAISPESAAGYIFSAQGKTREQSIDRMLKEKYGNKYHLHASERADFERQYDDDPDRFAIGKPTLKRLKSILHPQVKGQVNLLNISEHLEYCQLRNIASVIWPY